MRDEDLNRLDFNSLKVLKVLGEENNTQAASLRLKMGQSAVSKALNRLRQQFGDPLFTRKLHGLEPTPMCQMLLARLPYVMNQMEALFTDSDSFQPEGFSGSITIHINPSLCHPLTNILIDRLHELAPNARLRLEDWSQDTERLIEVGQVDLGVNYYPMAISSSIYQEPICYPKFKLCVAQGHPLTKKGRITVEDVANTPLILASRAWEDDSENYIETYLKRRGYIPKVILRSDKLDVCSMLLKQIPALAPVSEIVSSIVMEEGLELIDIEHLDDVTHYPVAYFINERVKATAFTQWLLAILTSTLEYLKAIYENPNAQYHYPILDENGFK